MPPGTGQEFWSIHHDASILRRHHVCPRRAPFRLAACLDVPLPVAWLSPGSLLVVAPKWRCHGVSIPVLLASVRHGQGLSSGRTQHRRCWGGGVMFQKRCGRACQQVASSQAKGVGKHQLEVAAEAQGPGACQQVARSQAKGVGKHQLQVAAEAQGSGACQQVACSQAKGVGKHQL